MNIGISKPTVADDMVGTLWKYKVSGEEIFTQIAEATSTGFVELRAANPAVDAWVPSVGAQILIPSQHILPEFRKPGLVINLGDFRLYQFDKDGAFQGSWPIGIGKVGRETPLGTYRVTELRAQPTWWPTRDMRHADPTLPTSVPPGPNNPLGEYAVRIGWDGYALHGTNKPAGVGRMVSSGCIRLYEEDIRQVFERVSVGDDVHIIKQPVKFGWHEGQLYLEAHPSAEQTFLVETKGIVNPATDYTLIEYLKAQISLDQAQEVDWAKVAQVISERRGIPVKISGR